MANSTRISGGGSERAPALLTFFFKSASHVFNTYLEFDHCSRLQLLELQCAQKSPGSLAKMQILPQLAWYETQDCISHKLYSVAAAGPWTHCE